MFARRRVTPVWPSSCFMELRVSQPKSVNYSMFGYDLYFFCGFYRIRKVCHLSQIVTNRCWPNYIFLMIGKQHICNNTRPRKFQINDTVLPKYHLNQLSLAVLPRAIDNEIRFQNCPHPILNVRAVFTQQLAVHVKNNCVYTVRHTTLETFSDSTKLSTIRPSFRYEKKE